jgi:hypothetical protein
MQQQIIKGFDYFLKVCYQISENYILPPFFFIENCLIGSFTLSQLLKKSQSHLANMCDNKCWLSEIVIFINVKNVG